MATIKEVMNDIKSLRGADVKIFGQPTHLNENIDEYLVDVLDVLEVLRDYEVGDDFDSNDLDYWNYVEGNNTYNWSGCISNDINYQIYELDNSYTIELSVHRYGDVRTNYTDSCYLVFDSIDEFLYTIAECDKYICLELNNKEYYFTISVLSDCFDIYDNNDNYICNGYGNKNDIIELIKEAEGF